MWHRARLHVTALTIVAAGVFVWTWPILDHIREAVPGTGPGDNLTFVWNVWWARYALTHQLAPLSTPMLLYPFGADLSLHTHTLLPALAVSFIANPVAAQNVLIVLHLFLNFSCAYLLAWRETRAWAPAVLAAIIFGWAPYPAAHLTGHFNLIAAWVLPLTALLARRVVEEPRRSSGILLGLNLAAIAYVDYYYFVYACLLALVLAPGACVSVLRRGSPPETRAIAVTIRSLWILALVALGAAAAIVLSGGWLWHIGSRAISVRSVRNPVAVAWLCAVLAVAIRFIRTRQVKIDGSALSRLRRPTAVVALVLVIGLAPLLLHAFAAVRQGTYVSQQYFWRSAPAGIDLLTLVAGNPSSALYGRIVRPAYEAWNVNLVEHVGWVGPGAGALAVIGLITAGPSRRWLVPLAVFGLWAIGPSLQVAGHATPLWMPAVLVRWIPIVANARIPARAIVVVYLAIALLAAFGLRHLLQTGRPLLGLGLFVLVILDLAPAPPPMFTLSRPAVAIAMAADSLPGAVLHVPFGLRDGFGQTGRLDPDAMWLQTIHHRPIAGGFVARLPRDIAERYRQMPVLGTLLRLSSGERLANSERDHDRMAAAMLARDGFRYLVVNRQLASEETQRVIREMMTTAPVSEDAEYTLYALEPPR
jgi:hypothetical protein